MKTKILTAVALTFTLMLTGCGMEKQVQAPGQKQIEQAEKIREQVEQTPVTPVLPDLNE